ncbi:hypothetical protein [Rhizobium sp. Nf11,1]|uniref:hypothetical protein n=1 Tax=Rhizobium sp. Nf11,1 TaxID=3404923 RepID=UPI003D353351
MIAIGVHTGGPELSNIPLVAVLKKAMTFAKQHREPSYDSGQEGWVNPVFVLPGSVYKPDFEGFKIGHFSRKEKGVVVTIAVPLPSLMRCLRLTTSHKYCAKASNSPRKSLLRKNKFFERKS